MLRVNELLASLAAMGGFLVGAFVMLAIVRALECSMRQRDGGADLAPGVASHPAVMPSASVVLGREVRVLRASSAPRAFGLVRGDTLMAAELLAMARKVRRDGEI